MRYEGQGYDVAVELDEAWLAAGDRARIAAAFHAAHRATYGHATEANEVWLKELRVHIVGAMPRQRVRAVRDDDVQPRGSRQIRLFGGEFTAAVVSRAALGAAQALPGPAIVNQMDTTTLIPPGWAARIAPSGALILRHADTGTTP
jgi:N-methylhydantoinase A